MLTEVQLLWFSSLVLISSQGHPGLPPWILSTTIWFLTALCTIIDQHVPSFIQDGSLVLLSDRQRGLIDGVESAFPRIPHGYCLRHLQENFHKKFKNVELRRLLWMAASTVEENVYETALRDMAKINPLSVPWLLEHADPRHWAELYFVGKRYGHLTSNIAESLNSWLLKVREMPVLPMFE